MILFLRVAFRTGLFGEFGLIDFLTPSHSRELGLLLASRTIRISLVLNTLWMVRVHPLEVPRAMQFVRL